MKVAVDGREIEVPSGASVLSAVRAAGRDVPSLSWDPRTHPAAPAGLVWSRLMVIISSRHVPRLQLTAWWCALIIRPRPQRSAERSAAGVLASCAGLRPAART